jgi:hypothetical protein
MVKQVERVHRQAFTGGAEHCLWAYALVQFDPMNWKRMLAYVTGSVDEEFLAQNEYLVTENRILRKQIQWRRTRTHQLGFGRQKAGLQRAARGGADRATGNDSGLAPSLDR